MYRSCLGLARGCAVCNGTVRRGTLNSTIRLAIAYRSMLLISCVTDSLLEYGIDDEHVRLTYVIQRVD
jgi:hypothetical protein